MLIIGEGSQKSNLMRKTMELGIKDQVVFTGCVPNDKITAYYNACELFLFASTTETQGIVLLEAMAAGLPVIAVGGSGVKDVVLQGRNGYLTKEDIYEWVEKLEQVSSNKTMYEKMSINAREEASKYTSLRIARTALTYYRNAIHRKEMENRMREKLDADVLISQRLGANYEKKAI